MTETRKWGFHAHFLISFFYILFFIFLFPHLSFLSLNAWSVYLFFLLDQYIFHAFWSRGGGVWEWEHWRVSLPPPYLPDHGCLKIRGVICRMSHFFAASPVFFCRRWWWQSFETGFIHPSLQMPRLWFYQIPLKSVGSVEHRTSTRFFGFKYEKNILYFVSLTHTYFEPSISLTLRFILITHNSINFTSKLRLMCFSLLHYEYGYVKFYTIGCKNRRTLGGAILLKYLYSIGLLINSAAGYANCLQVKGLTNTKGNPV